MYTEEQAAAAIAVSERVLQTYRQLLLRDAEFRREPWRGVSEWLAFLRDFSDLPAAYKDEAQKRIQTYRQIQSQRPRVDPNPRSGDLEF